MWEKTYKYIKYFGLHHIFQGTIGVHKICRTQTYCTCHGYERVMVEMTTLRLFLVGHLLLT